MKKTFISAVILTALLTTGCQDKEAEAKVAQQLQTIAQLTSENSQLKTELSAAQQQAEQAVPAIFAKQVVLFDRNEKLTFPKGTETLTGEEGVLTYRVKTLNTGVDWLDSLFLQQLSLAGTQQLRTQAQLQEEYQQAFEQQREEMLKEPVFQMDSSTWLEFIGQREKIATFIRNDYNFSGGAHGMLSRQYWNIDLTTHKILTLKDVFGGNEEKLKAVLWQHYANGAEDTFTAQADFTVSPQFYFTNDGIRFVYNPYEIASYAEGPQEIFVWWGEVWDLLSPSFKQAEYFPEPEDNL